MYLGTVFSRKGLRWETRISTKDRYGLKGGGSVTSPLKPPVVTYMDGHLSFTSGSLLYINESLQMVFFIPSRVG